jgi:ligand-binding sensor domain-containing protein
VFDIHKARTGALWFATNKGVFRRQNELVTRFTTADGLPSDDVKVILESPDGTI